MSIEVNQDFDRSLLLYDISYVPYHVLKRSEKH